MSWSSNRKTLYFIIVLFVIIVLIALPIFFLVYKAPTCFDGKRNGNETGVDCGGSCSRLCASAFLPASVSWSRYEEIAPSLYNLAAYIINPNPEGEAKNVPFKFSLYDNHGIPIEEYTGYVDLPPHRNSLAFIGAINVKNRKIGKVTFEFTDAPQWRKRVDPLSSLVISAKDYSEDESGSSLMVGLKNTGSSPINKITVFAVLFGGDGNALGFSKTVVDGIYSGQTTTAPFTWPIDRKGEVVSIEIIPVAE